MFLERFKEVENFTITKLPLGGSKMNENQVFAILKILGSFRYYNVKFLHFFIQTTCFRFETTYIIKKFNKKKI